MVNAKHKFAIIFSKLHLGMSTLFDLVKKNIGLRILSFLYTLKKQLNIFSFMNSFFFRFDKNIKKKEKNIVLKRR